MGLNDGEFITPDNFISNFVTLFNEKTTLLDSFMQVILHVAAAIFKSLGTSIEN
jgi:hypothetical protein